MSPGDRSQCPIAFALDVFGDRWTLLVVRDLLFRGLTRFSEFAASPEGIATNVLTDRLRRLEDLDLVVRSPDPEDGRRAVYTLTEAGLALGPAMIEILLWGAKADPETPLSTRLLRRMREDPAGFLDELAAPHRERLKTLGE